MAPDGFPHESCRSSSKTHPRRRRRSGGGRRPALPARAADEPLRTRPIPHSGEQLPVVGIGTTIIFDFDNDAATFAERREVVRALVAGGGKLIETAHSYGRAEDRVGDVVADLGARDKLFLATKFSYRLDRDQATASLQSSLKRLRTGHVDLMQAWNGGDENFDFGLLRESSRTPW
jgi:aryl-alcohol dehydrogenase-like predicted oxidoreductase